MVNLTCRGESIFLFEAPQNTLKRARKKPKLSSGQASTKSKHDEASRRALLSWLYQESSRPSGQDETKYTTVVKTEQDKQDNSRVLLWQHSCHINHSELELDMRRFAGLEMKDFYTQMNMSCDRAVDLFPSRSGPKVPLLVIALDDQEQSLWTLLESSIALSKSPSAVEARMNAVYDNLSVVQRLTISADEIVLSWAATASPLTHWSPLSAKLAHDKTFRGLLDLQYPDQQIGAATAAFFYDVIRPPPLASKWPPLAASGSLEPLKTDPMQFQKNAVSWMLEREIGSGQHPNLWITHANEDDQITFLQKEIGLITCAENDLLGNAAILRGGLLSDEMGLGKSLEILATIILNPRPGFSREEKLDHFTGNVVRAIGATLIVTPSTILYQWLSEAQKHTQLRIMHYTGMSAVSKKASANFSDYDIVVTSYAVLSAEVHYAAPASSDRVLRHPSVHQKRRSPLTQVEWWRVVMDEAQMIQTGNSAAAQVACQLPRVIAWIVTGTPIATSCGDLFGLLHFLRMDPLYANGRLWRQMLSSNNAAEYVANIFEPISCRNTKALISKEMSLPPQYKYLFEVRLSPLEKETFRDLLQSAFEALGLDIHGSPPASTWTNLDLSNIQRWITQLRQACSHPQAGQHKRGIFTGVSKPLLSLDEVLSTMKHNTYRDLEINQRAYYTASLERGRVLEYKKDKTDALEIWKEILPHLSAAVSKCEENLSNCRKAIEIEASNIQESRFQLAMLDLRHWRELLHRCLFFLGTIYFQLEQSELEKEYYARAKDVRRVLLSETEQLALNKMRALKELSTKQSFVTIPEIRYSQFSGGIQTRSLLERLQLLTEFLNEQANQLDDYRELCIERLTADLADQNDDPSGEEYQESAILQEEAYAYQELIKCFVNDRTKIVLGQTTALSDYDTQRAARQDEQDEVMQILNEGFRKRAEMLPARNLGSLYSIRAELRSKTRTIELARARNQSTTIEVDIALRVLKQLDKDYVKQKECVEALQKEVEFLSDSYNVRLEYYRQFQAISDSVKEYTVLRGLKAGSKYDAALERARGIDQREELSEDDITEDVRTSRIRSAMKTAQDERDRLAKLIDQGKTRARYLDFLGTEKTAEAELCMICTQSIVIGAFTICGHMYCKDCFYEWFRNHRACPICKTLLKNSDSFQTITLQADLATSKPVAQNLNKEDMEYIRLSDHYSLPTTEQKTAISEIELKTAYSSKVDAIVRHIRSLSPGSKSVVYSNFLSVIDVIGFALHRSSVQFELLNGSGSSKKSQSQRIENFREDPECQVLLLWGKSQSAGLTLVNATNLFLVEPLLSPAVEQQIISRIHRIGQTKSTNVFQYAMVGTLEIALLRQSSLRQVQNGDPGTADLTIQGQLLQTATSLKSEQPDLEQAIMLLQANAAVLSSKDDLIGMAQSSLASGE